MAQITLAGHKSEIFFLRSCQGGFRVQREGGGRRRVALGVLRQRAGGMIGGGRGEGRHCVAGGAVLLPDATAKRRCLLPFSQLENWGAEKLCDLRSG